MSLKSKKVLPRRENMLLEAIVIVVMAYLVVQTHRNSKKLKEIDERLPYRQRRP